MPGKRAIPASELARDYAVSLNDFAEEVMALLARIDNDPRPARSSMRRREICAAVSAAMTAALDASTLTAEEREKLDPLLREVLLPFWNKHCASDENAACYIVERRAHYLAMRVAGSQVKSAVNIVATLLDALELSEEQKAELTPTLAPSFAHRMVADVYHINDVRARLGLQLSLVAMVSAMLEISVSYDSILRLLRVG
jgi:hypothetical protein